MRDGGETLHVQQKRGVNDAACGIRDSVGSVELGCRGQGGAGGRYRHTIEGGAGKTIRLDRTVGRSVVTMDSVTLDANGKGSLSTAHLPLDFYYLNFDRGNYLVLALDSTLFVRKVSSHAAISCVVLRMPPFARRCHPGPPLTSGWSSIVPQRVPSLR